MWLLRMFEEIFLQAGQTVVNLFLGVLSGVVVLAVIWTRRRL